MGSKPELRQLKIFVDSIFDLQTICAEYNLEASLSPSDEIREVIFNLHTICAENCLETWLGEVIRKQFVELQLDFAEFEIQLW